jgi:hypothetical protein
MKITSIVAGSVIALATGLLSPAHAQSSEAAKQAAIERYLRAVPMGKMMEDTYAQIAKQVPQDKQAQFIADMRKVVKVERVEQIAKGAMLRTFTLEELNALADFYSSEHGASAMAKFGVYMGEVMPPLMQEIQRAVQDLQAQSKK